MKTFASELKEQLSECTSGFDAELYAEWFMQGLITDDKIKCLSEADFVEVESDISDRWGEDKADIFGDYWLSFQ